MIYVFKKFLILWIREGGSVWIVYNSLMLFYGDFWRVGVFAVGEIIVFRSFSFGERGEVEKDILGTE